ncbi:MAG: AsmA family protein [Candidatus Acidiferrales bacterium]
MAAWYKKKIVIIGAAVLILILGVLLILPYVLDIDRYRPAVVEQLEKATGRDIEIETLRLHFLPSTHVAVGNFRIRNPSGFPEGDTLLIESISIGVALSSLLGDNIEVTSVGLDGVALNLLSNEQGRTNYDFKVPSAGNPSSKGNPSPKDAAPASLPVSRIDSIAVRDVTVTSGSFYSRQKKVIPSWTLTGLDLDVRGLDLAAPDPLNSIETTLDLSSVEVSSPKLKEPLRFDDGEITVAKGAASGDFAAALGKLRADGTVKVASLAKPVADFTLKMNELNTNELAALAGGAAQAGPASGGGGNLLARGSVEVGTLAVPPLTLRNFKAQTRIYGNRVEVNPFSLQVFNGRAGGGLTLNTAESSMPASLGLKIEGVDVKTALNALNPGGKNDLTGTFESEGRFGLPLTARNPLAALGGQGTFAVRNGTVPGVNVRGAMTEVARLIQMDVPQGPIPFEYIRGDFRVADRRVHNSRVELMGQKLEATASGSFGFDQTLSYSGMGTVKGSGTAQAQQQESSPGKIFGRVLGNVMKQTMNISGARVPFSIRGTFADPKFSVSGPPTPIPIR